MNAQGLLACFYWYIYIVVHVWLESLRRKKHIRDICFTSRLTYFPFYSPWVVMESVWFLNRCYLLHIRKIITAVKIHKSRENTDSRVSTLQGLFQQCIFDPKRATCRVQEMQGWRQNELYSGLLLCKWSLRTGHQNIIALIAFSA